MEVLTADRIKALDIKENTILVLKDIDNPEEILDQISGATGPKDNIAIILGGESELSDLSKVDLLKACKQAGITAEDLK